MPSEDRLTTALQYVSAERDAFRSALAATLEQVRGIMAASHNGDAPDRQRAELGAFAAGRIRMELFPELPAREARPKKSVLGTIRHAQQLLTATAAIGDGLHVVDVLEPADLPAAVQEALATAGRAFAAAYAIELIRSDREDEGEEHALLAPLPPARWTRAEREVAPPLVVRVNGEDLRITGFEDLLQGNQKIVLLVDGAAPPAGLVRLIAPGVFVMQCRTLDALARLRSVRGPAIAAVFAEDAAAFVYDGSLSLDYLPATEPKRPSRTMTLFRQKSDLAWLQQLSSALAAPSTTSQPTADDAHQPGDQLAAWLLRQVELPNP
jgi:hypothetical protein